MKPHLGARLALAAVLLTTACSEPSPTLGPTSPLSRAQSIDPASCAPFANDCGGIDLTVQSNAVDVQGLAVTFVNVGPENDPNRGKIYMAGLTGSPARAYATVPPGQYIAYLRCVPLEVFRTQYLSAGSDATGFEVTGMYAPFEVGTDPIDTDEGDPGCVESLSLQRGAPNNRLELTPANYRLAIEQALVVQSGALASFPPMYLTSSSSTPRGAVKLELVGTDASLDGARAFVVVPWPDGAPLGNCARVQPSYTGGEQANNLPCGLLVDVGTLSGGAASFNSLALQGNAPVVAEIRSGGKLYFRPFRLQTSTGGSTQTVRMVQQAPLAFTRYVVDADPQGSPDYVSSLTGGFIVARGAPTSVVQIAVTGQLGSKASAAFQVVVAPDRGGAKTLGATCTSAGCTPARGTTLDASGWSAGEGTLLFDLDVKSATEICFRASAEGDLAPNDDSAGPEYRTLKDGTYACVRKDQSGSNSWAIGF